MSESENDEYGGGALREIQERQDPEELVDFIVENPEAFLATETAEDADPEQHRQYVRFAGEDKWGTQEFEVSMLGSSFPTKGQRIITDPFDRSTVLNWCDHGDNEIEIVDEHHCDAFATAVKVE